MALLYPYQKNWTLLYPYQKKLNIIVSISEKLNIIVSISEKPNIIVSISEKLNIIVSISEKMNIIVSVSEKLNIIVSISEKLNNRQRGNYFYLIIKNVNSKTVLIPCSLSQSVRVAALSISLLPRTTAGTLHVYKTLVQITNLHLCPRIFFFLHITIAATRNDTNMS